MTIHVPRTDSGMFENTPTMVTSSPCVPRTTAGRTLVVVRSVKGKRTRTISPGWGVVGIKVRLVQPFPESRLGKAHPFLRLQPIRYPCQHGLALGGGEIPEQLGDLLSRNLGRQLWHPSPPI